MEGGQGQPRNSQKMKAAMAKLVHAGIKKIIFLITGIFFIFIISVEGAFKKISQKKYECQGKIFYLRLRLPVVRTRKKESLEPVCRRTEACFFC
jgi:hypothetical protein